MIIGQLKANGAFLESDPEYIPDFKAMIKLMSKALELT